MSATRFLIQAFENIDLLMAEKKYTAAKDVVDEALGEAYNLNDDTYIAKALTYFARIELEMNNNDSTFAHQLAKAACVKDKSKEEDDNITLVKATAEMMGFGLDKMEFDDNTGRCLVVPPKSKNDKKRKKDAAETGIEERPTKRLKHDGNTEKNNFRI